VALCALFELEERKMKNSHLFSTLALIFICGSTGFGAASFRGLGFLPGDTSSIPHSVSADGSVVVGESLSPQGYSEAFRWTSSSGMVGLGYRPAGGAWSNACGVSADGSVVVGRSWPTSSGAPTAFRWTVSGGGVALGYVPGGSDSEAHSASADGSVVVGESDSKPFRWTPSGGMVSLGDLPGGLSGGSAEGVSADGSVVVGGSYSVSGQETFRWTSGGGMVGLGDLAGGAFHSSAQGVSADGSVVVGYGTSASGQEAFRWTASSGMVGLGFLPGTSWSDARGVSADGSIVVGYSWVYSSPTPPQAFYWTADGGMQNLKDLLINNCGLDLTGWRLTDAYGISPNGLTIVGTGINPDGYQEAYMATIPEPATVVLVGLGGVFLRSRKH
jgi:probable HAF family extracellular repeat protein